MRVIELDELQVEEIYAKLFDNGRRMQADEDYYIAIDDFRLMLLEEFNDA